MREGNGVNGPRGIWVVVVCSLCKIPATFTEIPVIYLQVNQHLTLQVMREDWQLRKIVESFHAEAFQSFSTDLGAKGVDGCPEWLTSCIEHSFTRYDWWSVQPQESPCVLHAFINGA